MKMYKEPAEWKFTVSGAEGSVELFGVNIFDFEWTCKKERAQVTDPIYGKKCFFEIWEVISDGKTHEFAAGEFSACVWGFYIKS